MTPPLVLLCAAAGVAVVLAAYGPRRWYRTVTLAVRPTAPEPSPRGYRLLAARNVVVALAAVAVAVPVTLDGSRLSEGELVEATRAAVYRTAPDVDETRLEAEVELGLGRDVSVSRITDDERGATSVEDRDLVVLEVTTEPRSERFDPDAGAGADGFVEDYDEDAPATCVTLRRSTVGLPSARAVVRDVVAGRCPDGA